MRFEDMGIRMETRLAPNAIFPHCACGQGVVANGIVTIGVLKEYQFACFNCKRTYRMGPTGRLYKVHAA